MQTPQKVRQKTVKNKLVDKFQSSSLSKGFFHESSNFSFNHQQQQTYTYQQVQSNQTQKNNTITKQSQESSAPQLNHRQLKRLASNKSNNKRSQQSNLHQKTSQLSQKSETKQSIQELKSQAQKLTQLNKNQNNSSPVKARKRTNTKKQNNENNKIQTLDDQQFVQNDLKIFKTLKTSQKQAHLQSAQQKLRSTPKQQPKKYIIFETGSQQSRQPSMNSENSQESQQPEEESKTKPSKKLAQRIQKLQEFTSEYQNQTQKNDKTQNSKEAKIKQISINKPEYNDQDDSHSPTKLFSSKNKQQTKQYTRQADNKFKDHQIKIILSPPKPNTIVRMNVTRTQGFLLSIWPEFNVCFQNDKYRLMSAKKVSRTPYSTFVISSNKSNYEENSQFYLGKAKSTIMGDQLDIFGRGLSPKNAFEQNVKPRQFQATVIYQTRILQIGQPRNFKVYVKRPEIDYYEDFPEIKMYGDEISLNLLYQNPHNRNKIIVLRNRKPKYFKEINGYMLNFRGRVNVPSVKNFILQTEDWTQPQVSNVINQGKTSNNQQDQSTDQKDDVMIFGKSQQGKFNFDVSYPLSPFIGFGIVLSSFDEKYFCE